MRSVPADIRPFALSVDTSDLDEARAVCGEHLYPRSLRLLDRSTRFSARFAFLHMRRFTLADVRYGAEMAGQSDELGSYHVNLPVAGEFAARQDDRSINGDVEHAAVYRPVGRNILHRSSAGCRVLALKVSKPALEDQLAMLLDAPVRASLQLSEEIDLRREPGRSWAALTRLIGAEIDNPTGLVFEPIVAAPLEESLLMSLLFAVGHQYQDVLTGRPPHCRRQHVARAIDAIQAEPQRPYTAAELAEIAQVSLPCLRQEFRRQVGMGPMAYLREVRLAAAHAELLDADPEQTSVAAVARRWGFVQVARFAARYRARYRVAPSETLLERRGH